MDYLKHASDIFNEYDDFYYYANSLVTISSGLSTLYKSVDSIDKSEYFYEQYLAYNDSVEAEKNSNELLQLKLEYEFQKKFSEQKLEHARKENESLKRESLYTRIITGVVILLLILFWRYQYQKNKAKKDDQGYGYQYQKRCLGRI